MKNRKLNKKPKTQRSKINFRKKRLKIGFLGPKGTFSHQAAFRIFGKKLLFVPLKTIKEVFEEVNNQEIDFGIVPAENAISGIVSETINCLIDYPLKVIGSYNLNVHHCLLSADKNKRKLKVIKSHEQAFSQSKKWLERNLPEVSFEITSSTTAPILENRDEKVGFIASVIAAQEYGLNILAKNIEDNKENQTKFYLVSTQTNKTLQKKMGAKKTLILFSVYDRVGILRDILDVFAKNNLNLTRLHSIPSRWRNWDYFFFLEVDALYPSSKIKKVLKEIEKHCPTIRVIGLS